MFFHGFSYVKSGGFFLPIHRSAGLHMLHLEDGAMPGHLPSFAGETLEDALEFLGVGLDIKICKIKGKRSISTAFQQQSCWINRVDIS